MHLENITTFPGKKQPGFLMPLMTAAIYFTINYGVLLPHLILYIKKLSCGKILQVVIG